METIIISRKEYVASELLDDFKKSLADVKAGRIKRSLEVILILVTNLINPRGARRRMDVLVVFGSTSDRHVFDVISARLKEHGVDHEVRVCSAHRTPEDLDDLMKGDYRVVIAGAGLAAHLPGVVASKTIRPVIGVPVKANFEGLDALLAIMQMPPGVPVLAVGVDGAQAAADAAAAMLEQRDVVAVIGDEEHPRVKKAIEVLEGFEAPFELNPKDIEGMVPVRIAPLGDEVPEGFSINVPLVEEGDDKAEAALNVLRRVEHGVWVGINRAENAAIAAVQVLNREGFFRGKLEEHRRQAAEKVRADDKALQEGQ